MKILYLIPSLDVGGAETDLVRLLPRFDRSRHQPIVWPFLQRGALAEQIEAADIPIWNPIGNENARARPGNVNAAGTQIRFTRIRELYHLPRTAWLVARWAAKVAGVRFVTQSPADMKQIRPLVVKQFPKIGRGGKGHAKDALAHLYLFS